MATEEAVKIETVLDDTTSPRTEIWFMEYDEMCKRKIKWFEDMPSAAKEGEKRAEKPEQEERLIMSPPPYNDLGKNARDMFSKGYHFGLLKLDCKIKTKSGDEFSSGVVSNLDPRNGFESLETKYRVSDYGLTFSEKWNTDNTLATEISVQDYVAKGLKLSFDRSFSPQTGSKTDRIKSEFRNDVTALNCDVNLDTAGPIILASAVLGYNGWLAGYQTQFNSQKSKITKNNFALGYSSGDFILHTNVNDGQEFGGSIYQKVSPKLNTAIDLNWSAGSNKTRFGIGCKYDLDNEASVRAKVNNLSQIGLGYQQKFREGISVYFSALIDGKNFNNGCHNIGVALELED
ncbi:voltage-dependent anion-selective channel-like [Periplaneta americana]|uniref:voltage-dependent anion-selective channel-like n=1 Tax=Periplaneta americana TaxID=6978 RepID=UPI0037E7C070